MNLFDRCLHFLLGSQRRRTKRVDSRYGRLVNPDVRLLPSEDGTDLLCVPVAGANFILRILPLALQAPVLLSLLWRGLAFPHSRPDTAVKRLRNDDGSACAHNGLYPDDDRVPVGCISSMEYNQNVI